MRAYVRVRARERVCGSVRVRACVLCPRALVRERAPVLMPVCDRTAARIGRRRLGWNQLAVHVELAHERCADLVRTKPVKVRQAGAMQHGATFATWSVLRRSAACCNLGRWLQHVRPDPPQDRPGRQTLAPVRRYASRKCYNRPGM